MIVFPKIGLIKKTPLETHILLCVNGIIESQRSHGQCQNSSKDTWLTAVCGGSRSHSGSSSRKQPTKMQPYLSCISIIHRYIHILISVGISKTHMNETNEKSKSMFLDLNPGEDSRYE